MKTKKQTAEIVEAFKKAYPVPACTLSYEDAWQLLVSVRLAAQCTDARVNVVTEELFKKYPSLSALAAAAPQEIEEIVRPCGLGKSKARDISAASRMLLEKFKGKVPATMEELLSLPGVGRKSANLILGDIYKQPAIVADTHCIRIAGRIGFVESKDPLQVENALRKVVAPSEGNDLCHRFVLHGRAVCMARSPNCSGCILWDTGLCREGVKQKKALERAPVNGK